MTTAPQSRQRPHRTKHRARARANYSSSPAPLDQRRYYDLKAGMSVAEIAARDNVTLAAVEKSLSRMRSYANQHSQEAAEIATRQLYLQRLPDANNVFEEALRATKIEARTELVKEYNMLTEREEYVEKTILDHVPDHATRLKATEALQKLLSGVQPKTPLLAIDARTQNNNFQGGQPQSPSALSSESIIRELRRERGLGTGDIVAEVEDAAPVPVEIDTELEDDLEDEDGDDDISTLDDGLADEDPDYAEDDDEDDDEEAGD